MPREGPTGVSTLLSDGAEDPHPLAEFLGYDTHGFSKVGVVGHQDTDLEVVEVRIPQEVRREVDVRPLLFGLDDPLKAGAVCLRQPHNVGEEVTERDFDTRVGAERLEVGVLSRRLIRIARPRLDSRREILDPESLLGGRSFSHIATMSSHLCGVPAMHP